MSACSFCGVSLEGKRDDARYCSSACRVEAWRLRRLLEGRPVGRYATAADRMAAYGRPRRGRRSQAAREGVESSMTTQTAGRRGNAPGPAPESEAPTHAERTDAPARDSASLPRRRNREEAGLDGCTLGSAVLGDR